MNPFQGVGFSVAGVSVTVFGAAFLITGGQNGTFGFFVSLVGILISVLASAAIRE